MRTLLKIRKIFIYKGVSLSRDLFVSCWIVRNWCIYVGRRRFIADRREAKDGIFEWIMERKENKWKGKWELW